MLLALRRAFVDDPIDNEEKIAYSKNILNFNTKLAKIDGLFPTKTTKKANPLVKRLFVSGKVTSSNSKELQIRGCERNSWIMRVPAIVLCRT